MVLLLYKKAFDSLLLDSPDIIQAAILNIVVPRL